MTKDVRVKSILNLSCSQSEYFGCYRLTCSTDLSIKIPNTGEWLSILTVHSPLDIREDVVDRLKRTGCHEDICNERTSAMEEQTHKEMEYYAHAFHKNYIELINDKVFYLQSNIDNSEKYLNSLKKRNKSFSL